MLVYHKKTLSLQRNKIYTDLVVMAKAKIEFVDKGETAAIYTICFEGEDLSEFAKFMTKFRDNAELRRDYQIIVAAISQILQRGVLERYFRPEGKMRDGVCALPVQSGKLRLYCLRLSDKVLIAGNGGVKDTVTYNENTELSGYVMDLQKFDKIIKCELRKGSITIEETEITGIDDKEFAL